MPDPTEADVDRLARLMLGYPPRGTAGVPATALDEARRALAAGVTLPKPEPATWVLHSVEDRGVNIVLRFEWSEWRDDGAAHSDRPMPKAHWSAIQRHFDDNDRKLAVLVEELAEARKGRDEALDAVAATRREGADPDVLAAHAKGVFDGLRSAGEAEGGPCPHLVTADEGTSHCALAERQARPMPTREQVRERIATENVVAAGTGSFWVDDDGRLDVDGLTDDIMALLVNLGGRRQPLFRARVEASGGGVVNLLVDRGTEGYPPPGRAVEIYEAQA